MTVTGRLGMRLGPPPVGSQTAVGTADDCVVWVRKKSPEEGPAYYELWVDGPRLPQRLRFALVGRHGHGVLTGDDAFDDRVEVDGEPGLVLALLDGGLRKRVRDFVRLGGRLAAGRLELGGVGTSVDDVRSALRLSLELARDLSSPGLGGICARLARNATQDPAGGARLNSLLRLQESFGQTQEALQASRAGLSDASAQVRLAAARFVKGEGLEMLEALVRDRSVDPQVRTEAFGLLASRLPAERAGPLLLAVVADCQGDVRRQAILELGRLREHAAVDPLIALLKDADSATAAAAASALGSLGEARAEPGLLKALRQEAEDLRQGAARALGQIGSVRSVEPLLGLLDTWKTDTASLDLVREAVASIQSRLAGAGAGQVSLAPDLAESGRLSLAAPVAGPGDLALAPELEDGE